MKTIYSIVFLALYCVGFSQSAQLASANKKYEKYSYIDAIEIYEKIAEKGYKSAELFKRLGNAYYFNGEIDKASKWYSDLFTLNEEVEPEYYFRYSQCLKSKGNYDEANKYLSKFNSLTNDTRGEKYSKNKDYLRDIEAKSGKYNVEETNLNTEFSDYGPAFFGKSLFFLHPVNMVQFHQKLTSGQIKTIVIYMLLKCKTVRIFLKLKICQMK